MCARLDSYIKSNNILCTNEFGFRKNSYTSEAIIEFLDYVYSSLDKKQSTIAEYLDFSKALQLIMRYRWVSSSIMASEVSYWAGLSLIWVIGNNMSRSKISAPLCQTLHKVFCNVQCWASTFLLYINDMHRSSDQLRFVHFADDTTVLHPTVTLMVFMPQWTGNW